MTISRVIGLFTLSLVLSAPLYATAEETPVQSDSPQPAAVEESSDALTGGECRPALQSCSVNSQCCANLCLLGLCL